MLLSALAAMLLLAIAAVQLHAAARALAARGLDDPTPPAAAPPSAVTVQPLTPARTAAWRADDDG
jgi:hypothetical protein